MLSISVFLASNPGTDPVYMQATAALGHELARRQITCIYGGSRTGLMQCLADSVLDAGGKIIGVTVQALKDKENFHTGLTKLHVTPTLNERKAMMLELSDGCIALPGGIGTYDEFFEVCALRQLGFHAKPCGLLNVNGFYDPLQLMLDTANQAGFLKQSPQNIMCIASDPSALLDQLCAQAVK
ncbi:TIGR00730 family Rossman fold protein [Desulfovibrionales bacterium]